MRLSWNEVRARAAVFAEDWKDAAYEKGEPQSFYNAFFDVFGVQRRSVACYEQHVSKLDNRQGFIDLFWPGVLLVEQKNAGRDLGKAYEQAGEYFDALPERNRPRYILVSDFQTFELHDLDAAGYRGHDLERFLVRIVFCLFADDTGISEPRDIFLDFIETRTSEDGADLGPWLAQLFEVLDTPEGERAATLDEAGRRAVATALHRRAGVLAGWRALDSGAARHAARSAGAVAARAGTDRRCPRLP